MDKKQVTEEIKKIVENMFEQLIQVKDLLVVLEAGSFAEDDSGSDDSIDAKDEERKEKGGKAPREELAKKLSKAAKGRKRMRNK